MRPFCVGGVFFPGGVQGGGNVRRIGILCRRVRRIHQGCGVIGQLKEAYLWDSLKRQWALRAAC